MRAQLPAKRDITFVDKIKSRKFQQWSLLLFLFHSSLPKVEKDPDPVLTAVRKNFFFRLFKTTTYNFSQIFQALRALAISLAATLTRDATSFTLARQSAAASTSTTAMAKHAPTSTRRRRDELCSAPISSSRTWSTLTWAPSKSPAGGDESRRSSTGFPSWSQASFHDTRAEHAPLARTESLRSSSTLMT